ncbi:MAG: hypothetical protein ACLFPJ_05195 [Candidatus Woesearchaeota archaeon]
MQDLFDSKTSFKIIEILSKFQNLSSKEIYNQIKKIYCLNISYQAIYKELQLLVLQNILVKNNLKYTLNLKWLKEKRNFLDNLLKKGSYKSCIYSTKNLEIFNINNLKELDNFIQEKVMELSNKNKFNITYWKTPHCWWLLGYPIEEELLIQKYSEKKLETYALITSNNSLDKKAKEYYGKKDVYLKINIVNNPENDEVVQVLGDYVILCKIPRKTFVLMNELFNKKKQLLNDILYLINFEDIFEVQIIKNNNLAKMYSNQIINSTTNLDY